MTSTGRYPKDSIECGAGRGGSNEDDLNITSTGRCPRGSVVSGANPGGLHRQTSTLNPKPYIAAKSMEMTQTWKASDRYAESSVTCGVFLCGSTVKIQHEQSVWRVVKEGPRNRMSAIPLMCKRTHATKPVAIPPAEHGEVAHGSLICGAACISTASRSSKSEGTQCLGRELKVALPWHHLGESECGRKEWVRPPAQQTPSCHVRPRWKLRFAVVQRSPSSAIPKMAN